MGRLLALILGGVALVLYVPPLLPGDIGVQVEQALQDVITPTWYKKLTTQGAGVFAGIALLLLAVRGRD